MNSIPRCVFADIAFMAYQGADDSYIKERCEEVNKKYSINNAYEIAESIYHREYE